jgi:hypothetical protein
MGHSVGRWEGDTLVVESFGFNDRSWLDHDGHPHSEALRMIERYRRPDFGQMEIEITLNDPQVYARPWTVALSAVLTPDTDLLEAVCNEKPVATRGLQPQLQSLSQKSVHLCRFGRQPL